MNERSKTTAMLFSIFLLVVLLIVILTAYFDNKTGSIDCTTDAPVECIERSIHKEAGQCCCSHTATGESFYYSGYGE